MAKGIKGSTPVCSVEGCDKIMDAKELCAAHYYKMKKYGDPLATGREVFPQTLLSKMVPLPCGCIWYDGAPDRDGYGQIKVNGKSEKAHRMAYIHFVGPIPEGLTVGHKCHDRSGCNLKDASCHHRRCVNPEHLALETRGENLNASPNSKAAKTHCPKGHPYSGDNLKINAQGGRVCVICQREAWARSNAKRRKKK